MKKIGFILFLVLFPINVAFSNGMAGTDFWFGFMENQSQPGMRVIVTSSTATNGTLSVPLNGWMQNFTVPANSSIVLTVPFGIAEALGNMSLENKGVHLISDDPVFVSIYNGTNGSDDASSVLPVSSLGYDYIALTYIDPPNTDWGKPEILIVATEDDTEILITPSAGLTSTAPTAPISVTLDRGQTYQIQSYWWNSGGDGNDLSGSFVESVCNSEGFKHKIAVFSGDLCSVIGGTSCTGCDHLMEQMWPISQLGTEFMCPSPVNRNSYFLKVAAVENGTVVNISGQGTFTLNSGQWQELYVSGNRSITSNKPIAVGQFTKGQECSIGLGDPFFAQIVPNSQMQTEWQFLSIGNGSQLNPYDSYLSIVAPNSTSAVFHNGSVIPPGSFQIVGNSRVAKIPIPSDGSTHSLISSGGFTAYVYGYGPAQSYNFNSGIYSNGSEVDFDISYLQNTSNQALFFDTLCTCEPVTYISTFDLPGYTVTWTFGDGQTATGTSVTHDYSNGIYDVGMYITDQSGCKVDSLIKQNVVFINCDIDGPIEPLCAGENVVLSSINSAFTYLWSTGDTTQSIVVNPQQTTSYSLQLDGGAIPICDSITVQVYDAPHPQLSDTLICETDSLELSIDPGFTNILWSTNETTPSIEVNQAGIYTVQAIDSNQCVFSDTASVTTQDLPQWTILGESLICEGDSTFLQGPNMSNVSFTWSTGESAQDIVASENGFYQLFVDDGICVSSDEFEVEVISSMDGFVSPDTVICADNFVLEVPDLPGTSYWWETGDADYFTTVFESGTYWVELDNQCESWSDTMEVTFDCSFNVYVPNAFTPDGDQINDVFKAEAFGLLDFEMQVFNRWGELVFQSTDPQVGWDGTYRGKRSPDGVYSYQVFVIDQKNDNHHYVGHVSLIR